MIDPVLLGDLVGSGEDLSGGLKTSLTIVERETTVAELFKKFIFMKLAHILELFYFIRLT